MPHVHSDLRIAGLRLVSLSLMICGFVTAQSIDDDLPLPRWEEERPPLLNGLPIPAEAGSHFNSLLPGESLVPSLPETPGMLHFGPRLTDTQPSLSPQIGTTDLSLFLHGSHMQADKPALAPHTPTPVLALRDLPADFAESLADAPSNDYLIDPQDITPEVARGELERLLEFHATDARIRLYVLVLETDQKLPDSINLTRIANGALTRQPSCLAIYPMGEPWRARLLLSQPVHDAVPAQGLRDMAADCIRDAQQADEADEQLRRYSVRLSTRLFWLQKALIAHTQPQGQSPPSLKEITSETITPTRLLTWQPTPAAVILLSSLAILLILSLGLRPILKKRRSARPQSHIWMLPESDVPPRLGGAFSAGAGAVLNYKV